MKRALCIALLLCTTTALLLVAGCSSEPTLIGEWKSQEILDGNNAYLTFTSDEVTLKLGDLEETRKYVITGENALTITNDSGEEFAATYELKGDTLVFSEQTDGETLTTMTFDKQ